MRKRCRGHHRYRRAALAALLLTDLLGACGRAADPPPITAPPSSVAQAPTPQPSPTPPPTPPPSPPPAPTETPVPRVGLPVRLKIPAIGVDAAVEYVGLTPDGAMDVPKDYDNTAWYQLGPRPGEPGNAVIAGHVDSAEKGPVVFWDLRELLAGDRIIVVGDDGVERAFVVTASASYNRTELPLDRVFGAASGARLNLITCDGVFDEQRREYDKNLVVYTRRAP